MTVTKLRMTALAPTTKRGFVVGILASLKECRTSIIGAISLGRNQFPEGAKTRFIAPRTGSSNPLPSSEESFANLISSRRGLNAQNHSGRADPRPPGAAPSQHDGDGDDRGISLQWAPVLTSLQEAGWNDSTRVCNLSSSEHMTHSMQAAHR